MLEFNEITKSFRGPEGDVSAVNDVSLSVKSGEFVGIQGESGSGKTTLLLIAGGLLRPTHGTVIINGQNPYSLPANERSALRAQKVGFVFQQFHMIPYLTVRDNILAPSGAHHTPNAKDRAEELITHFKLEHRAKHVPSQLSTGERQRTALARALLNRPDIILADEPTGNLDKENAEVVLTYLREFADNGGAVLMVSHDERGTTFVKRALYMSEGRINQAPRSDDELQ